MPKQSNRTNGNRTDLTGGELSLFTWAVMPFALLILLVIWTFTIPEMVPEAFLDDLEGGGIVEHGTVIFLMGAVFAGVWTLIRYRRALPNKLIVAYVLLWTIAALFFAGEEASWGQHYFNWESPAIFKHLNKQQETNIHNMSSWFNQKPRLLVETCVMITGILLPLLRLKRRRMPPPSSMHYWIWPTFVCLPVTMLLIWLRVLEIVLKVSIGSEFMLLSFGSAEYREYNLAIFFFIFLMSIASRAGNAMDRTLDLPLS